MKSNSSLISIGLLVLAFILYVGGIGPMSTSLLKTRSEVADEEVRLTSIELTNGQREDFKSRVTALEQGNAKLRATWLSPLLNSYAMRVKSLVDAMATECGLTNVEYEEGPLIALPVPKEQLPESRTARRAVRVKALADYAAAVSFVMRAEKDLPLLTVQSLSIQQPKNGQGQVDRQEVVITFEWPAQGEVIK